MSMISDNPEVQVENDGGKAGSNWDKECSLPDSTCVVTVEQPPSLHKRKHPTLIHGDQSTWKCDTCAHRNFASASECFKCKTSQEVQLKRKKENPNNWTCTECRNSNWPHRTVCNRCSTPKSGYENQINRNGGGDADWTCLNCDNINRPFRQECNKCKMSKQEAVDPRTQHGRTNQDWLCMSCGNSNYPYRIACNKCKLPKQQAMTATRSFDSDKPENWLCFNCDNVNLPFRTECNKCKLEKKEGINPETAFKRTNRDWKCTVCENVNFYYRVFCNKCQLPKSEIGEEMGRGGGSDGVKCNNYPSYGGVAHTAVHNPAVPHPAVPHSAVPHSAVPHSAVPHPAVPHSAVPLPSELRGVPTEPIEQAAAQMFQEQVQKGTVPASAASFTMEHDIVNNRTDNWTCYNCDNLNYPLRTQCNKCSMSKAEAVAPETRAGRLASGDTQWQCAGCGNNNYHFRLACNKCKADRPPRNASELYTCSDQAYSGGYPVQQYASSYNTGGSVARTTNAPTSNWICSDCENVNWPKRTKCNKCGVEKSAQNPNWLCAYCKHINYSFVSHCNSCKAAKDS